MESIAATLGYPGGERLYHFLKYRYHWAALKLDCVRWCKNMRPQQLENSHWKPPPYLQPSKKSLHPFHTWCIDLITNLPPGKNGETILIVAVCMFSKWVEAAPLVDRKSSTTAAWVHQSIVCRYGVPRVIRCDSGKEF